MLPVLYVCMYIQTRPMDTCRALASQCWGFKAHARNLGLLENRTTPPPTPPLSHNHGSIPNQATDNIPSFSFVAPPPPYIVGKNTHTHTRDYFFFFFLTSSLSLSLCGCTHFSSLSLYILYLAGLFVCVCVEKKRILSLPIVGTRKAKRRL